MKADLDSLISPYDIIEKVAANYDLNGIWIKLMSNIVDLALTFNVFCEYSSEEIFKASLKAKLVLKNEKVIT